MSPHETMSADDRLVVSGLELSRRLYAEAVEPILTEHLPRLGYAAALVGSGSEVLGFDTERSTDHAWGARLLIFVDEDAAADLPAQISGLLKQHLPAEVGGYPTRFGDSPLEPGTPVLTRDPGGRHGVTVGTVSGFLTDELGISRTDDLDPAAWLTMSEQHLLEVTAGAVFRDDLGRLTAVRRDLVWYPDDVWRYRLAAGWKRIAQHEAFVGRTGEVGDDLGSHLVTLAIIRDVMQLAFLLERRYAPYEKWFGTAYARLELAGRLRDALDRARFGSDWRTRESAVVDAVVDLAHAQNDLEMVAPIDPTPRAYFTRPFTVVGAERFADALTASITDPIVRALPEHLGGIDQYVETTDGRKRIDLHQAIRAWLRTGPRRIRVTHQVAAPIVPPDGGNDDG